MAHETIRKVNEYVEQRQRLLNRKRGTGGATDTDMNAGMSGGEKEQMERQTALGWLGTAEDIADAAAFLAYDDARWVTGQRLVASGGLRG